MLDASMQEQLKEYLKNLRHPIEIQIVIGEDEHSQSMLALAQDIESLSEKVTLTKNQPDSGRIPRMSIAKQGESPRVSFAGIPLGHEFSSLVLALLQAGGHPSKEKQELQEQAKVLDKKLEFEIFISLSCHTCPDVVQAINLMAALNPNVSATMVDGGIFQDEIKQRDIMGVPAVYLNGESFCNGRTSLAEILSKVDENAASKEVAALEKKEAFDVLVIGGGPAGASAAIYCARKGIRTGIVSERFGGQLLDTLSIENFISVTHTQGPKLVSALEEHVKSYDIDVIDNQRVTQLNEDEHKLKRITLENGAQLKSKSIIIATGARWREMNVPGEQEYRNKGVAYCPHCDGPLFKNKDVAVIGGGNSGIEAAIDLAGIVNKVTVLEFMDTLRADDVLVNKAKSMGNIDIITQAQTTEVIGDNGKVSALNYKDRTNDEQHSLPLNGIFVQIGLVPNSEWLPASINRNERGEIIIDKHNMTSMEGVFAAGDVSDSAYNQIIISMGSGASAALGAFDYLIRN